MVSQYRTLFRVFFANFVHTLGCEKFEGAHTAEAVAEKIHKILKEFLIQNKVGFIVSDSASNMVAGKFDSSNELIEFSLSEALSMLLI